MGLFGQKEKCAICGETVSALTKMKVADGIICAKCSGNCSPLTNVTCKTVEQIISHINSRENNKMQYADFSPTDVVGKYLQIDRQAQTWCCPALYKQNPDIFPFSDVIDFELVEDGVSITKGGLGSAVVGGLTFGGVGAIVGGGLGKKQKDIVNKLSVHINLKNEWIPHVEIQLINTKAKKGGLLYSANKELAQQIISLLTFITDSQNVSDNAAIKATASVADEILKFKQLLDIGAITQEEFDKKKQQLLS